MPHYPLRILISRINPLVTIAIGVILIGELACAEPSHETASDFPDRAENLANIRVTDNKHTTDVVPVSLEWSYTR